MRCAMRGWMSGCIGASFRAKPSASWHRGRIHKDPTAAATVNALIQRSEASVARREARRPFLSCFACFFAFWRRPRRCLCLATIWSFRVLRTRIKIAAWGSKGVQDGRVSGPIHPRFLDPSLPRSPTGPHPIDPPFHPAAHPYASRKHTHTQSLLCSALKSTDGSERQSTVFVHTCRYVYYKKRNYAS